MCYKGTAEEFQLRFTELCHRMRNVAIRKRTVSLGTADALSNFSPVMDVSNFSIAPRSSSNYLCHSHIIVGLLSIVGAIF